MTALCLLLLQKQPFLSEDGGTHYYFTELKLSFLLSQKLHFSTEWGAFICQKDPFSQSYLCSAGWFIRDIIAFGMMGQDKAGKRTIPPANGRTRFTEPAAR
ncbi:hypothetical protein CDAR_304751 [Caerostris darwini]|uniref:Uncharacterized protein n=1 Tax=Caerostris darwini TaxID=1538125 RepID=A0AAV4PVH9_9ARAC|nr:hypothetical protein CDAR_304751 [Caerostris darwini]